MENTEVYNTKIHYFGGELALEQSFHTFNVLGEDKKVGASWKVDSGKRIEIKMNETGDMQNLAEEWGNRDCS